MKDRGNWQSHVGKPSHGKGYARNVRVVYSATSTEPWRYAVESIDRPQLEPDGEWSAVSQRIQHTIHYVLGNGSDTSNPIEVLQRLRLIVSESGEAYFR